MMPPVDELRPPTAGRVLEIWRSCRETAGDELERTLLCNARVLAESCYLAGERVFPGGEEALDQLTGREMETLLRALAREEPLRPAAVNPAFDPERFRALGGR